MHIVLAMFCTSMHIMHMKKRLNTQLLKNLVSDAGSIQAASKLIQKALECSDSKAEKMVTGRYPSIVPPAEQRILAELLKCKREDLFEEFTQNAS